MKQEIKPHSTRTEPLPSHSRDCLLHQNVNNSGRRGFGHTRRGSYPVPYEDTLHLSTMHFSLDNLFFRPPPPLRRISSQEVVVFAVTFFVGRTRNYYGLPRRPRVSVPSLPEGRDASRRSPKTYLLGRTSRHTTESPVRLGAPFHNVPD